MSSKRSKAKRNKGTTLEEHNEGTTLLPGRRPCLCEASKHQLVANCLNCGRIVCAQEGTGSCFTCGQTVMTREQRQELKIQQNIKQLAIDELLSAAESKPMVSTGLKDIAASFEAHRNLEKAIGHKDQMLDFDRNSSVRTKVIDDQNDYFSLGSQNWISSDKRRDISKKVEELHENKLKKNRKILIDLMEHSAIESSEPVIPDFDHQIEKLIKESELKSDYQKVEAKQFIEHNYQTLPVLKYLKNDNKRKDQSNDELNVNKNVVKMFNNMRVQDKELMTMSDEGMCLSVNQPFASLLVYGIKRFEGRNWYSAFRGRLWIRSNSKAPDQHNIDDIHKLYTFAGIKTFPDSYPTSSLVGCVTVTDCLPFEEYRDKYPEGDTEASYILVCEDHKRLSQPLTTSSAGNRIYKLNDKVLIAAQKALKM